MPVSGIKGGQLKVLSEEDTHQIHMATLAVLEEVGIKIEHEAALKLMTDNGCKVDFKKCMVKIPEDVLKKALESAPSKIVLYGKKQDFDVVLDNTDTVYTMGGAGATWVLDLEGRRRPATLKDLVDLTRLQDVLENMHIAHFLVLPQDIPQEGADRIVFATMLKHTQRPHHTVPAGPQGVRDHVKIASILAGGTDQLLKKPFYLENVCVESPLYHPKERVDELMEVAKYGIPMFIEEDAVAGATTPFTIAGTLVEQNANILCAVVLAQMVNPGAPCVYSISSGIMDMRVANYSAAAPESTLLHIASSQMAHFYHLPFQGGNTCDSKLPDAQMGYERALHFLALAMGGCNVIHVATGNLEQMRLASYEQCLLDNEILGAAFRIVQGINIDKDTLGVDVIKEIGPQGNFLAHEHTLRYLRKTRWMPTLTDRKNWEIWEIDGAKDMRKRAAEEVKRILKEHNPQYVSEKMQKEIDRVAQVAQKECLRKKATKATVI